ncbi:uncharacterized protein LOC124445442 isoform X2 [Xenia sp. Carnegie-2017]|uniref:uncharacterized protein LOC124445442 isoform X2 n=1 Tax=Xenia sp. Carnegie-2017 TaxID=2897299 RepID=UPI001F04BFB0|nr:uncharacterized protein LOC124445442 isoform X2 [Xenia sp. Carnegie-2017]
MELSMQQKIVEAHLVLTVGTNMIAIWGVESRLYLAIDEDGTVFTTKVESKECVFKECLTMEFFSQFETCHKNNDELAWFLSIDSNGKINAKPNLDENSSDRSLDFVVKIPAERAEFCQQSSERRRRREEKQPIFSRKDASKFKAEKMTYSQYGKLKSFSSQTASEKKASMSTRDSSSESQFSQSEKSYSFTDSMEIAGFTSDSSMESLK